MPIDYSKWDKIEISDDEDDTHPNVDTPSLFKWRHEARIQREKEKREEAAKKNARSKLRVKEVAGIQKQIADLEGSADAASEGTQAKIKGLTEKMKKLEDEETEFQRKERELQEYEEAHPEWNVDNISQDKHNRTIINKPKKITVRKEDEASSLGEYFEKHGPKVKEFGMINKWEESHKFLQKHMYLVCEHLGSYLVIWAVDLACEDKHELKERVAHQAIVAQYIMELARSLKRDPRDCVDPFFQRIKTAEKQYKDAFDDEFKSLLGRIEERKKARFADAAKKVEEEEAAEREARLGPAGLDPLEVLEELPPKMREAFETQNTPLLHESFQALPDGEREAVYHKVVGSGLWVPQGSGSDDAATADAGAKAAE